MTKIPAPASPSTPSASELDTGRVENGRIMFGDWRGSADAPSGPPPAPLPPGQRVGFAIIGLGRLTLEEILPAFVACEQARVTALVSGGAEKARVVAEQYGIPQDALFGYDRIGALADRPDVQAVFIVTPNALHRDHVLAAAAAGKHVLCEKPMANTSEEAREMIAACRAAGRKLMIAYRCRYDPFNRAVVDLVRGGTLGAVRLIDATNMQAQGPADQWRLKGALSGGGALPDIGIYCLNAARSILGEEPMEVFARQYSPPGDPRYAELDETLAFMLRFPSGAIASCATSYGAHEARSLRVRMERGWADLDDAFAYQGQRLRVAHRAGNIEVVEERKIPPANQFALEIDHFAECILHDRTPRTPGEEGLQDHIVMEALYRSAREGIPLALS